MAFERLAGLQGAELRRGSPDWRAETRGQAGAAILGRGHDDDDDNKGRGSAGGEEQSELPIRCNRV